MQKTQTILLPVFVILFLIAAGWAFALQSQVNDLKNNPQKFAQESTQDLVKAVGKLMVLPEGETPTVATVSDPAKLKDQPFFAKAKVGDKVLIYTNARKAILYSETDNKIIEVAPLLIGDGQNPAQPTTPAATSTR